MVTEKATNARNNQRRLELKSLIFMYLFDVCNDQIILTTTYFSQINKVTLYP